MVGKKKGKGAKILSKAIDGLTDGLIDFLFFIFQQRQKYWQKKKNTFGEFNSINVFGRNKGNIYSIKFRGLFYLLPYEIESWLCVHYLLKCYY